MFTEEMQRQPDALRDLIHYYRGTEGREALQQAACLAQTKSVTFAGMGSSLYAAYSILPRLRTAGWQAEPLEAGEALHYALPVWKPNGLLVTVSQSGESAETRALAEAFSGGVPVIAVTNDPESRMAQTADVVLPLHAGHEAAISTKTFTNTLGVLYLLASALLGDDMNGACETLEAAAETMEAALRPELDAKVQSAAKAIHAARSVHFIGRGPSLASVYEGSLVIGEGARVTAVGLPAGSFRHGPLELADENHASILFMPDSPTRPLLEKLCGELAYVGSMTIALTDSPSRQPPPGAMEIAIGPVPSEAVFPFAATMVVERILAAAAALKGITPGDFRYGGKITAEE
jgi:glucosamine--fructose-6-phosphate aminotransferase (isomerizing)